MFSRGIGTSVRDGAWRTLTSSVAPNLSTGRHFEGPMIQLTFVLGTDRTITTDDLECLDASLDPVEKTMLLILRNHVRRRLDNLACPLHGQYPSVIASGAAADDLTFSVDGCCQRLVDDGTGRLAATSSLRLSVGDGRVRVGDRFGTTGGFDMAWYRKLALALALIALVVAPAFAKGGGGGGAGGGGAGGGGAAAGGGVAASGAAVSGGGGGAGGQGGTGGHGGGTVDGSVTTGQSHASPGGRVVGAGRGTALTARGSRHRSSTATRHLSTSMPGKANPSSGVIPGLGKVGTVPTTPGHKSP